MSCKLQVELEWQDAIRDASFNARLLKAENHLMARITQEMLEELCLYLKGNRHFEDNHINKDFDV